MAMISPSILHDHGDSVTTAHGSYNASNLFSRLIHASKRTTSRPNTFFSAVLTTIIAIVEPATTLVVGPRKTIINTIILNFFRAADVRIYPATGVLNVAVVAAALSVGRAVVLALVKGTDITRSTVLLNLPRAALRRIFIAAIATLPIIAPAAFSLAFAAAAESVIIASKTLVAAGGAAGLAVTPAVQAPAVYTLQTRMARIKNAKAARLPPETTFISVAHIC
mmetsp:Transcript_32638/g.74495  ORF Transcript_32638/g.74495 Transcript_32638/m.74495 type:complete len:223 (-) Transcript_32638:107-775(-)